MHDEVLPELNAREQTKDILYVYAIEEFGKTISLIRKKEGIIQNSFSEIQDYIGNFKDRGPVLCFLPTQL